jgi:hypothetical protein
MPGMKRLEVERRLKQLFSETGLVANPKILKYCKWI